MLCFRFSWRFIIALKKLHYQEALYEDYIYILASLLFSVGQSVAFVTCDK